MLTGQTAIYFCTQFWRSEINFVTVTLPKWSLTGCRIFSQSNFNFSIWSAFGLLSIPNLIAVSDLISSERLKLRESHN